MKTSELSGAALDWAVSMVVENSRPFPIWLDGKPQSYAAYSTDWAHGGPIIEREELNIFCLGSVWEAWPNSGMNDDQFCQGPTLLIAAMRCYVASKLGNEVEIPEELVGEQA